MKTIKILPKINNIDFAGRLTADPVKTTSGKVITFRVIRNFGGEKSAAVLEFTMFKPKDGFPEFLKKGAPVVVHAYFNPNTYTDKNGKEYSEVQYVVKNVEMAELIEKTISDDDKDYEETASEEIQAA